MIDDIDNVVNELQTSNQPICIQFRNQQRIQTNDQDITMISLLQNSEQFQRYSANLGTDIIQFCRNNIDTIVFNLDSNLYLKPNHDLVSGDIVKFKNQLTKLPEYTPAHFKDDLIIDIDFESISNSQLDDTFEL